MQIASSCNGCTCHKCESSKENYISDTKLNNEKCQNTQPNRHRSFARSRQSKMKIRYTYGNHHRLDHTYAAAVNFSDVLQPKPAKQQLLKGLGVETSHNSKTQDALCVNEDQEIATLETSKLFSNGIHDTETKSCGDIALNSMKDENEDISLKSTWLRNLCLEYQPPKKLSKSQTQDDARSKENDAFREKPMRFHFSGTNGMLKQYQRNRKINKTKQEHLSTCSGKTKNIKSVQEDKKRWIAALALVELAQSK